MAVPTLNAFINFGTGPSAAQAMIIGQGIIGTNVLADNAALIVDVSNQIDALTTRRGRNAEADQFQTGTCSLRIVDQNGDFNSQNLDNYFGKILRIDVSQSTKSKPYRVPADNPMVKVPQALPEIWAFGLRDPWRCSFDTKGSKQLICGDVQEDSFESIKIIEKGKNMGWPIVEGKMRCFSWDNPQAHKDNCDKSTINPAITNRLQ